MSEAIDNSVLSLRETQIQTFPVQEHCHTKSEEQQDLQRTNLASDPPNLTIPSMQEKQIFLCGSCHQGFDTLELCKDHIMKVNIDYKSMTCSTKKYNYSSSVYHREEILILGTSTET